MLTLHYHPGNASMTPHMLLEELGAPYRLELVDRQANAHKSPAYLKLNPNGLIPVLVDGELVMYETAAICLHLLDTHAGHGLAPAPGTPQRAHFYKWLAWLSSTLQPALTLYWYPERWADDAAGATRVRALAEAKIGALLEQLDAELARHGRDWLLGDAYSAVDPYALMLSRWTRTFARPARAAAPRAVPAAGARPPGGAARVRAGTARAALGLSGAARRARLICPCPSRSGCRSVRRSRRRRPPLRCCRR